MFCVACCKCTAERMLRTSPYRVSSFVVSRIEPALHRFAEGRPLTEELVSEFALNQKPVIESVQDLVFMHRLVQAHVPSPSNELNEFLSQSSIKIFNSLESISTSHLSVICSCLADSNPSNADLLEQSISELLRRTEESFPTRIVARMCKGVARLAKLRKDKDLNEVRTRLQEILETVPVIDLHVNDIIHIASAGNLIEIPEHVMKHAEVLVPFMSDVQARRALELFTKTKGSESVVAEIKRNLVRSRPARAKRIEVDNAGLPEVGKAPHFHYVRKIDLR